MDKFMRRIGLSGKAFIPLIVGFGCNVPGIMAARTLDTHRERVTTVLISIKKSLASSPLNARFKIKPVKIANKTPITYKANTMF
jgi:Fe2+ transport system protein B